jgi:hypothetical protein
MIILVDIITSDSAFLSAVADILTAKYVKKVWEICQKVQYLLDLIAVILYFISQGVFFLKSVKKEIVTVRNVNPTVWPGAWELVYFKRIFCGRLFAKKRKVF